MRCVLATFIRKRRRCDWRTRLCQAFKAKRPLKKPKRIPVGISRPQNSCRCAVGAATVGDYAAQDCDNYWPCEFRSEAERLIKQGAVELNGNISRNVNLMVQMRKLTPDGEWKLRVGKKKFSGSHRIEGSELVHSSPLVMRNVNGARLGAVGGRATCDRVA